MNDLEQRYQIPSGVYATKHEEYAVILDLRTGIYHGLDEMAVLMWKLFSQNKTAEVIHQITSSYECDEAVVTTDVKQFLKTMQEKHLLIPTHLTPSRHTSSSKRRGYSRFALLVCTFLSRIFPCTLLHWLEAFLTIIDVKRRLRYGGFELCIQELEQLPACTLVLPDNSMVQQLARVVRSVAWWQSDEAACLHQYLTLCFLLRRRHILADFVLGVSTHPFFAHAWLKSGPDAIEHALLWDAGLGQDTRIERLQHLSVLFCTGNGSKSFQGDALWEE